MRLPMSAIRWLIMLILTYPLSANAGELIIRNVSSSAVVCHADGYTAETGWPTTWAIAVPPGESARLQPNYRHPGTAVLDWAECGGLRTRAMDITPERPDGLIVFT